MDGMQDKMNFMEAKMNGMDDNMNGMVCKMEELKIYLNKLLQEMVTNGESVVKETHDEIKRNVNHDSIDFNVTLNTHHVPKIDMRKFDGRDPRTWLLQMDKYFDLHEVKLLQNVRIESLYLEPNQFLW